MKKLLNFLTLATLSATLFSCAKDYTANPSSAINQSINPYNPLDSAGFAQFTNNAGAFSCYINGQFFQLPEPIVRWGWNATTGSDQIIAAVDSNYGMVLNLKDTWSNGIFDFDPGTWNGSQYINKVGKIYATVFDSVLSKNYFQSIIGNSGRVYIIRNDGYSDTARLIGRFYFNCRDTVSGTVINVTEGYFNIKKW